VVQLGGGESKDLRLFSTKLLRISELAAVGCLQRGQRLFRFRANAEVGMSF
jgi:hypothetical protein